eukprot:gene10185-11269_t
MANFMNTLGNPAPSTFGGNLSHFSRGGKLAPVNFHRGLSDISSFPSSLATPIICEYFDEVKSVALEEDDYLQAYQLCGGMMGSFRKEEERVKVWNMFFRDYFTDLNYKRISFEFKGNYSSCTDGSVVYRLPMLRYDGAMILNCQVKNELGSTQASAPEQCMWYHYGYLSSSRTNEELLRRYCCPAILCSVVGPYISFSVGVHLGDGNYVCDPVTPFLQMMVLRYQQDMVVAVARALRATKNALTKLQAEYMERVLVPPKQINQLGYPYVRSFTDNNGKTCYFEYQPYDKKTNPTQSKKLVYTVTITKADEGAEHAIGSDLVVKFTKTYCEGAHRSLSDEGLAPRLFHIQKLPGGWFMVVMEHVSWPTLHVFYPNITESIERNARSHVKRALDLLRSKSFVHGDLRANNILVSPVGDIRIVDFDHSGRTDDLDNPARYPPFLNKDGAIQWAPGVECGGPLSCDHDLFFYNQIFPPHQEEEEMKS